MPEGLSAAEVGTEIAEHKKHAAADKDDDHHDRWLSIVEALLLSLVAVLAAYSGYAAAKWGTESSVMLAKASAERTKANRADIEGIVTRTLDSASFNAWFSAFTTGNANAERLAARRMRPGYRPAFNAWLATDPAHNPNAPPGPRRGDVRRARRGLISSRCGRCSGDYLISGEGPGYMHLAPAEKGLLWLRSSRRSAMADTRPLR